MKPKKIWMDRDGAGGIALMLVAVIAVVAILAVAYMAFAQIPNTDGGSQNDHDNDDDDKEDPFIGFIQIDVKVKVFNPDGYGESVEYSINEIKMTLVDEPATMSILDSLEWWDDEAGLKLVCTLKFPYYNEVLIKNAEEEWRQKYEGTWDYGETTAYTTKTFTSGAVRYHGSYVAEVTLYEFEGGQWNQKAHLEKPVTL